MTTDEWFPVVLRSVRVDPANSTDVPGDLANFTEDFNCSKLSWRRYGLGLLYYFLDSALYRVALKKRNSRYSRFFPDFALINSYLFSACWIDSEPLFLIIITPRSSNLVENFLFMSNFLWTVIFGICPISRVPRHD